MYVSVIPYFLAANVFLSPDPGEMEEPITKLPSMEHIYNAEMLVRFIASAPVPLEVKVTGSLKCRNKDDERLICKITDIVVETPIIKLQRDAESEASKLLNPFEIAFDGNGVKNITVASSLPDGGVKYLTVIASLLHIGTDLTGKMGELPLFDAKENNTYGLCDTKFNVTRYPLPETNTDNTEKNYYLRMVPWFRQDSNEGLRVRKVTNVNQCEEFVKILTEQNKNDEGRTSYRPLKAEMDITDTGLFKSTRIEETVYVRNTDDKNVRLITRVKTTLELKDIKETNEVLPQLPAETKTVPFVSLS